MKKICIIGKWNINPALILPRFPRFVKKNCGSKSCRRKISLLFAEGLAVRALVHGGVYLMGAHQDAVQGAVVLILAVVSALLDGALNALVGMAVHGHFLL